MHSLVRQFFRVPLARAAVLLTRPLQRRCSFRAGGGTPGTDSQLSPTSFRIKVPYPLAHDKCGTPSHAGQDARAAAAE
jgi:hypothetical protein